MENKKAIVGIMYDFDKTLCTKDMQDFNFIPSLGMNPVDYWKETNDFASKSGMERILASLYMMVEKAKEMNREMTREDFFELGKGIVLFRGVEDWFKRINDFGEEHNVIVEHYVISSGIDEMIQGTPIAHEFKRIYACEYFYHKNGHVAWPNRVVNYTTKTQFLFRINKGTLDVDDDVGLNEYRHKDDRRIPFKNMIYIGDGLTDVPCMQLVRTNGGQSIAVYRHQKKDEVKTLLSDGRVDFLVKADYSEGKELDHIIKMIIEKISVVNQLRNAHKKHIKSITKKMETSS
ncbi:MAG: HAD family hydrolase [Eubacteriaceae bacterium]